MSLGHVQFKRFNSAHCHSEPGLVGLKARSHLHNAGTRTSPRLSSNQTHSSHLKCRKPPHPDLRTSPKQPEMNDFNEVLLPLLKTNAPLLPTWICPLSSSNPLICARTGNWILFPILVIPNFWSQNSWTLSSTNQLCCLNKRCRIQNPNHLLTSFLSLSQLSQNYTRLPLQC